MQVFWRFLKSFCHVFICQWRTKFMTLSAESLGVHLLGYYLIGKQWLICNFMLVADTNWQLGIRWEPFRHQYWALWSIYRAICYFCQLDFDVYVCVRIWFVFQKSETRYITVIRCDSILKKKRMYNILPSIETESWDSEHSGRQLQLIFSKCDS